MKQKMRKRSVGAALLVVSVQALAGGEDQPGAVNNPATAQELPQVVVIGNAPLPGVGLPLNQVATNVQTAGAADLTRQHSLGIGDYLNRNMAGISISKARTIRCNPTSTTTASPHPRCSGDRRACPCMSTACVSMRPSGTRSTGT
jgi:hypothetical protein